jgi:hypothetical protein
VNQHAIEKGSLRGYVYNKDLRQLRDIIEGVRESLKTTVEDD